MQKNKKEKKTRETKARREKISKLNYNSTKSNRKIVKRNSSKDRIVFVCLFYQCFLLLSRSTKNIVV